MYHIWDIDSMSFEKLKYRFSNLIVRDDEGASKALVLEYLNNNELLDTKVKDLQRIFNFYNEKYKKRYHIMYTEEPEFKTYFEWFQDYMVNMHEREEVRYYLNHLSNQELADNTDDILRNYMVIDVLVNRVMNGSASIEEIANGIREAHAVRKFFRLLIERELRKRKLNISIFTIENLAKEYVDFDVNKGDILVHGTNNEKDMIVDYYLNMEPLRMFKLLEGYVNDNIEDAVVYLKNIGYDITAMILAKDKEIINRWDHVSYYMGSDAKNAKHILNNLIDFANIEVLMEELNSGLFRQFVREYLSNV